MVRLCTKFINLGNNDLYVSPLGLGCMGMSECYGAINDNESIQTIHRAYELGINHFDTADCYGIGHNEILLSKAIKSFKRDSIVISTKCGFERRQNDLSFFAVNNSPEYIKKCCDNSLKRLDLDYIDLFYLHRVSSEVPIEVSMQALADLVKAGKIRNIGLSEVSAKTIATANSIHPIAAIQSEYSLWSRDAEKEVIPLSKSLNIGFVAYSPTGRGFFSGKIRTVDTLDENDIRKILPRFQKENITHNLQIVRMLEEIAKTKSCTPAQIALAWILAQGNNITAIPGTKQISHLEENVKSIDIILSGPELIKLNNMIPVDFASGERMPENFAKFSEY